MVNLGNDWDEILKDEFQKDYYRNLRKFLVDDTENALCIRICMIFSMRFDIHRLKTRGQ